MSLSRFLKSLINIITGIAITLLSLRFILRLFGASASNNIVRWIYDTSGDILGPFRGIFPTRTVNGFVFEFSTLLAIVLYGILGMFLIYIIDVLTPRKKK